MCVRAHNLLRSLNKKKSWIRPSKSRLRNWTHLPSPPLNSHFITLPPSVTFIAFVIGSRHRQTLISFHLVHRDHSWHRYIRVSNLSYTRRYKLRSTSRGSTRTGRLRETLNYIYMPRSHLHVKVSRKKPRKEIIAKLSGSWLVRGSYEAYGCGGSRRGRNRRPPL